MDRVYNFSSGPATLPLEVLEKAREELLNYNGSGMSVMELPYTSKEFKEIITSLEASVRKLLDIPHNYKVLFLPGGASAQYTAIPLNLFSERKCADYVITSQASRDAWLAAKRYGDAVIAASAGGSEPVYNTIPEVDKSNFRPDSDYAYIAYTNVPCGTKYNRIPDTGSIPLVADMTGFLFSEPIDVSKFGLIFASAESNFGIAGLTIVIVREELIGRVDPMTPATMNYKLLSENDPALNGAPVFGIYMMKLMVEWMLSIGGLDELKRRNEYKASLIYAVLDRGAGYYTRPVDGKYRSMMVVRFHTGDAELDKKFIAEAEAQGLVNLGAEANIGGMCAALYNSMPMEGIEKLRQFMKDFSEENPRFTGLDR